MMGFTGGSPFNSGPQQHYVLQAACSQLERWARGGVRTPGVDAPVAVLSGLAALHTAIESGFVLEEDRAEILSLRPALWAAQAESPGA